MRPVPLSYLVLCLQKMPSSTMTPKQGLPATCLETDEDLQAGISLVEGEK